MNNILIWTGIEPERIHHLSQILIDSRDRANHDGTASLMLSEDVVEDRTGDQQQEQEGRNETLHVGNVVLLPDMRKDEIQAIENIRSRMLAQSQHDDRSNIADVVVKCGGHLVQRLIRRSVFRYGEAVELAPASLRQFNCSESIN